MGILCITSGHIASTKFKVVLHGLRFDGLSVLGDNWLIINLKETLLHNATTIMQNALLYMVVRED